MNVNLTKKDFRSEIRYDWTSEEILEILSSPLMDLIYQAQTSTRIHFPEHKVQLASLYSIKTGGCPEDCKYCSQSAHYKNKTGIAKEDLANIELVLDKAKEAKDAGATRFCMGAAWRQVRDGSEFDSVLAMVRGVRELGMEACVTLGMITKEQADRLAEAGLTSYNHNLDTSPEFYKEIISTRKFEDRLTTLEIVREAGISLCTGGIIGLGETKMDRARMLQVLASLSPHPESVPINTLVAVPGTPLEERQKIEPLEMVRMVATARIVLPTSRVRLSAGRESLTKEAQLLCFLAGANSIFYGDRLLTTDNSDRNEDLALIREAGLQVEQLDVVL